MNLPGPIFSCNSGHSLNHSHITAFDLKFRIIPLGGSDLHSHHNTQHIKIYNSKSLKVLR